MGRVKRRYIAKYSGHYEVARKSLFPGEVKIMSRETQQPPTIKKTLMLPLWLWCLWLSFIILWNMYLFMNHKTWWLWLSSINRNRHSWNRSMEAGTDYMKQMLRCSSAKAATRQCVACHSSNYEWGWDEAFYLKPHAILLVRPERGNGQIKWQVHTIAIHWSRHNRCKSLEVEIAEICIRGALFHGLLLKGSVEVALSYR